ncbi:MAG: hypothetical protein ACRCX2_26330 [Paraclostridium sp.]
MALMEFSNNPERCDDNCREHLEHVIRGMKHLIKCNEEKEVFTSYYTAKIEVAIKVLEGAYSGVWGEDFLKEIVLGEVE